MEESKKPVVDVKAMRHQLQEFLVSEKSKLVLNWVKIPQDQAEGDKPQKKRLFIKLYRPVKPDEVIHSLSKPRDLVLAAETQVSFPDTPYVRYKGEVTFCKFGQAVYIDSITSRAGADFALAPAMLLGLGLYLKDHAPAMKFTWLHQAYDAPEHKLIKYYVSLGFDCVSNICEVQKFNMAQLKLKGHKDYCDFMLASIDEMITKCAGQIGQKRRTQNVSPRGADFQDISKNWDVFVG
jgi:hypothetical protein